MRVYRYGAVVRGPVSDDAEEQLRLAHDLWNACVAIHRPRDAERAALADASTPQVVALLTERDAIEARANAATRGPWEWSSPLDAAGPWARPKRSRPYAKRERQWSEDVLDHYALLLRGVPRWVRHVEAKTEKHPSEIEGLDIFDGTVLGIHWPERKREVEFSGFAHEDKEFIAHARSDVPALVAEVRRLQAEVRRLQAEGNSPTP